MRYATSILPVVTAALGCVLATRSASAFTLVEKQLPVTVQVDPAERLQYSYLVWGGYSDSTMTNLIIAVKPLGLLPAVQRTDINTVLSVPFTSFDSAASVLMCDGSVRVAMGLNGPAAATALGPPAQTFTEFFGGATGGPSEQSIINAFVAGNETTLGDFFKQYFKRIGSPLTTPTRVIGFSTAVADGSEQVIERPQGDTNFDGAVNFTDLLNLAQHYGNANGTYRAGDLNGDGMVNFTDLLILAQHYGDSITPGLSASAAAPVPEPWAATVLTAALLLAWRRSPRHPPPCCRSIAVS